jgi:protein-disulfide isomerase
MKRILGGIAIALALAAVPVAAQRGNWIATVAQTSGGHVLGNPAAKVKLVEFASYTCPHCAEFEKDGAGALKLAWVQSGKASFEVRHLIRDGVDLTAAILANCGPKEKFFQNHAMFLTTQDTWMGRATFAIPAQKARWSSGPMPSRWKAMAADLGFYDMMETRGYSRAQVDQCLNDEATGRAIVDQSNAGADALGVNSTPSFAMNGKLLAGVHTWAALQKEVAPAL